MKWDNHPFVCCWTHFLILSHKSNKMLRWFAWKYAVKKVMGNNHDSTIWLSLNGIFAVDSTLMSSIQLMDVLELLEVRLYLRKTFLKWDVFFCIVHVNICIKCHSRSELNRALWSVFALNATHIFFTERAAMTLWLWKFNLFFQLF